MASLLADGWMLATVLIENTQGGTGTGFIVVRRCDPAQPRAFVITNKHVLSTDPSVRSTMQTIRCSFNSKGGSAGLATKTIAVPVATAGGVSPYREHPDADTDVCAVEITSVLASHSDLEYRAVGYDHFGDIARRTEMDITTGEDIVTLGYPLGIKQGASSLPLVRQGIIATHIGTSVQDHVSNGSGGVRPRTLRAFLIDGGAIPGSSGSPVVLKPIAGRFQHGNVSLGAPAPVLLGIIAETKYAPVTVQQNTTYGFAGLGLAFDVETIKETVELYFP